MSLITKHQLLHFAVALPFAIGIAAAQGVHEEHSHHKAGRSVEEWLRVLENPGRDAWQSPEQVVEALGLNSGDDIADIGAGTGYFSVRFAKAVGPSGKVYAVDVDPNLVKHLGERAAEAGVSNLAPVLAESDDPKIPDSSVDVVFICNVLHHIEGRASYYKKLQAALRPGGRLVIVDFYKRDLPVGPPVAMKIAEADLIAEAAGAGFSLADSKNFLQHQYFLIFRASAQN